MSNWHLYQNIRNDSEFYFPCISKAYCVLFADDNLVNRLQMAHYLALCWQLVGSELSKWHCHGDKYFEIKIYVKKRIFCVIEWQRNWSRSSKCDTIKTSTWKRKKNVFLKKKDKRINLKYWKNVEILVICWNRN